MTITSTVGAWRVIENDIYGEQLNNLGVFNGAIQDIAFALAGRIGAENCLEFQQFLPPQSVNQNDITGWDVKIKVDGMTRDELLALIQADIYAGQLDILATTLGHANSQVVRLQAGMTAESLEQLKQLAIANKALASLTQEQREAIMATRLLCPVPPVGGAA